MLKLKDIANDCSFTNSDDVVKFLVLTHNQNSRVKDALLDKMKGTSTLTECLAIAKTVESTIEMEKLSKTFLQNVLQICNYNTNVLYQKGSKMYL